MTPVVTARAIVEEVDGEEDVGEVGDREGDHPDEGGLGAGWRQVGGVCEARANARPCNKESSGRLKSLD